MFKWFALIAVVPLVLAVAATVVVPLKSSGERNAYWAFVGVLALIHLSLIYVWRHLSKISNSSVPSQ